MLPLKYVGSLDVSACEEQGILTRRISLDDAINELKKFDYWYLDTETYAKDFDRESHKQEFLAEKLKTKGKLTKTDTKSAEKYAEKKRSEIVFNTRITTVRLLQIQAGECVYIIDTHHADIEPILAMLPDKCVGVQNGLYDLKIFLSQYGVMPYEVFDTMLGHRIIKLGETSVRFSSKLGDIVEQYMDIKLDKSFGSENWGGDISPDMVLYSYYDVAFLSEIIDKMIHTLNDKSVSRRKDPYFTSLHDRVAIIEMRFLLVLCEIELAGIPINVDALTDIKLRTQSELDIAMAECERLGVDPASSNKIQKFLAKRDILVDNADKYTLSELAKTHSFVETIIKARELSQIHIGVDKFLPHVENGKIYPSYRQIGAGTGRMSSYSPPVQGIPRPLKNIFYHNRYNRTIMRCDYPAIEPRIMAVYCNEKFWLDVFSNQGDVYIETVSKVLNIPKSKVTKDDRQKGKAIVLGFQYGMGIKSFISYSYNTFGIKFTYDEARQIRYSFFEHLPKIHNFHQHNGLDITDKHKVICKTMVGRQAYATTYTTANNYPIQGTGADILKIACIMYNTKRKELKLDAPIVNVIHDEIIIDSHNYCKDQAGEVLKQCMEDAANMILKKFKVECEIEFV